MKQNIHQFMPDLACSISATSIGASVPPFQEQPYDLITRDGIRISIHSAAYIQSDDGETPDHVVFSLDPAGCKSDIHIFCLYTGMMHDDDPSDRNLWQFMVFPTSVIDDTFHWRESVTLPVIKDMNVIPTDYNGLPEAFRTAVAQ